MLLYIYIYGGNQKLRCTAHNSDRLFCRHASPEKSKGGRRKKENANEARDKIKYNESHSTITDRSFFQRISRAICNFSS